MYPRGVLGDKELPSRISSYLVRVDLVRVDLVRIGIWYELVCGASWHLVRVDWQSCKITTYRKIR